MTQIKILKKSVWLDLEIHSLSLKMVESYKRIPHCKVYPMLLTWDIFCFSPLGTEGFDLIILRMFKTTRRSWTKSMWGFVGVACASVIHSHSSSCGSAAVAARTITLLNSKTDQPSALRLGAVRGSHRRLLRTWSGDVVSHQFVASLKLCQQRQIRSFYRYSIWQCNLLSGSGKWPVEQHGSGFSDVFSALVCTSVKPHSKVRPLPVPIFSQKSLVSHCVTFHDI